MVNVNASSGAGAEDVAPLEMRSLKVTYGAGPSAVEAIGGISARIGRGEFVCIVGPSGCGKTTLLRAMSGLLEPTSGEVLVGGRRIAGPPPELALVFQDYTRSLFPWLTVEHNVELPLKTMGLDSNTRHQRSKEALANVGLTGFERKYPWQLSGGMQQRVAIARAIAYKPAVLLMDEPFASVDAQTRADLEDLMLRLQSASQMTVVFVTHDIDESVYLGSRILVLSKRPSVVRWNAVVNLPKTRDQIQTKSDPLFVELRNRVAKLIHSDDQPAQDSNTNTQNLPNFPIANNIA